MVSDAILSRLANEFDNPIERLRSLTDLLEEGNPVAYVARHARDRTGGMDEARVREIKARLLLLREIEERKAVIRQSAIEHSKLTPEFEARLQACFDRVQLDDMAHAFRPHRPSRATEARERGLTPLGQAIKHRVLGDKTVAELAADYVDPATGPPAAPPLVAGMTEILADDMSEDPEIKARLRAELARGTTRATVLDPRQKGAQ